MRRRWRRARAEPPSRVVCAPGDRRDIRDLIVMPAEGGIPLRRLAAEPGPGGDLSTPTDYETTQIEGRTT
jgi:hypothetical protein